MNQSEYFCLRWNNHGSNLAGCLSRLFQKEALCDVTLVCPQQGKFQAHQTILSACSPFFEELFLEYKTPHPVVILKDYKATDIRAILEFMYLGEVNVPQSSYNEFIKTAKGLQILGLNTADNLNFKEDETDDKDKRNNNNNESPTSKLLPSPIVPPTIKLPHKYSQQDRDMLDREDRERDRDDSRGGGGAADDIMIGLGGRPKHHHHDLHDAPLKYDRDDDQDRDSSPTPAEQREASAHYSSSKRKRKNTSSVCDSSMTSTYNFSATERQSDSGLPLSLGTQKLSPREDDGRRISPASRNQIHNIKSEMSEMPGIPGIHPELLPRTPATVTWGSSSQQPQHVTIEAGKPSPPVPPLIGIHQQQPPRPSSSSGSSSPWFSDVSTATTLHRYLFSTAKSAPGRNESVIRSPSPQVTISSLGHPKFTKPPAATRKGGRFRPHWLEQFGWLKFDETNNIMFCTFCRRWCNEIPDIRTSFVEGNSNFRLEIVNHHDRCKAHRLCTEKEMNHKQKDT